MLKGKRKMKKRKTSARRALLRKQLETVEAALRLGEQPYVRVSNGRRVLSVAGVDFASYPEFPTYPGPPIRLAHFVRSHPKLGAFVRDAAWKASSWAEAP